jgi:hypothetical protein
MMKIFYSTILMTTLFALSTSVHAGAFDRGRTNISVVVGSGGAFTRNYTVIGVGVDYLVQDGLQLGIDVQAWLGDDPSIYKVSPQLSYVFNRKGSVKPYAGGFYRATFIDGLENLESAGFRVGAYFNKGTGYQMGVGYVYERYLGCAETVFNDCTDSYPEVVLSISIN